MDQTGALGYLSRAFGSTVVGVRTEYLRSGRCWGLELDDGRIIALGSGRHVSDQTRLRPIMVTLGRDVTERPVTARVALHALRSLVEVHNLQKTRKKEYARV